MVMVWSLARVWAGTLPSTRIGRAQRLAGRSLFEPIERLLLTRRHRHPTGCSVTGSHRNDVTQLISLLDKIPHPRSRWPPTS